MKINLYYVEGISRIDTPSFNTKNHIGTIEDQEDFFLTKLVKSIETTFYPPYYHNTIKFDQEDLVLDDNVNYLSLEYQGKTYYYFVDEISYVSEGIIQLEVSMDTIQTFMFDIYLSSGIIERKFINRWKNEVNLLGHQIINRDYKRENLSNGLYELIEYTPINMPLKEMTIVAKYVDVSTDYACIEETTLANDKTTYYPSLVRFQPVSDLDIKYNGNLLKQDLLHAIHIYAMEPTLSELFVIPFKGLGGINYSNISYIEIESYTTRFRSVDYGGILPVYSPHGDMNYKRASISSYVNDVPYVFTFTKNIQKSKPFNTSYLPVMLDENYLQLVFGSRSNNTSYPLYENNSVYFSCRYYASFLNGSRYYYITTPKDDYKDVHLTIVADYEPIKLDIITEEYAQFNATNKYRWLEAIGASAINASKLFIDVSAGSMFAKKDIMSVLSNPRSYTPKRGALSSKAARTIKGISRGYEENMISAASKTPGILLPLISQGVQDANKKYAPDILKQSGTMGDISSDSYQLFISCKKVNDYEQCAQYYHRNGYLVNEYITQVSNIFNSVKNRYYFDMLKMSIPEVHLHNHIEDEDTVGLIEERLTQGLRLWNVLNEDVIIGDFTYDNVENDYLS